MHQVEDFLDKIAGFHVLVVGDLMLDRFLYGAVDRISPEAPVPVLSLRRVESMPGGAANVAMNLACLGCTTSVVGCVGNDERGKQIIKLLQDASIKTTHIQVVENWPTTTKTRVIGGLQHMLRVDEEASLNLSATQWNTIGDHLVASIQQGQPDAVILQDYNKGLFSEAMIELAIETASKADIPVMVDPKDHHFYAYQGVKIFKPNLRELSAKVPFVVTTELDSLRKASNFLRERLGHELSCVTLSERGLFMDDGEHAAIYQTRERQIADVSGAGDAVLSVLTLGYLCNLGIAQLANLANTSGGIVCEEAGVKPLTKARLIQELREKFL